MDPVNQPQQDQNPFGNLLGKGAEAVSAFAAPALPLNPFQALVSQLASSPQQAQSTPQVQPTPAQPRPVIVPPDPPKTGGPIVDIPGWSGFKGNFWAVHNLQQAFDQLKSKGIPHAVSSAFRTREDQEALYAKYGPERAALPGTSNHEKGFGFDLEVGPGGEKILEQFGFARSVKGESWHWTFQPGLSPTAGERVWADDDPRMQKFRQSDKFQGSTKHLAQSISTMEGYNNKDTSILLRLWDQESGFNPEAKSPVGALGIGQIMPENLPDILGKIGATYQQYKTDPGVQIRASLEFMRGQLEAYDGNWAKALAAYNGGPGAVQYAEEHGYFPASEDPNSWYVQTVNYVAKILKVSRQTATQWIVGNDGPKAEIPSPDQARKSTMARLGAGASRFVQDLTAQVGKKVDPVVKAAQDQGLAGAMSSLLGVPLPSPEEAQAYQAGQQQSQARQLAQQDLGTLESGPVLDVGSPGLGPAIPSVPFPPAQKSLYDQLAQVIQPVDKEGNPLKVAGTTQQGVTYYQDARGNLVNAEGRPLPGMTLQADSQGLNLVPTPAVERKESWGDWFSAQPAIIGEAGKSLLRGLAAGVVGVAHLQSMAMDAVLFPGECLRAFVSGPEAAKAHAEGQIRPDKWVADMAMGAMRLLEPTKGGPHEQTKAYARARMGLPKEAGILDWVWATAAGDTPMLNRAEGILVNLSIEAPYLAGMEIMSQILGPSGAMSGQVKRAATGEVEGFTGLAGTLGVGGGLTFEGAMKVPGLRNLAEKIGKPAFEEMTIWGSINAAQMMSETTSRELMHGKPATEAVANGLAAAMLGYTVGLGFGLGMVSIGHGASTLAGSVATKTQNKAADMVMATSKMLRNWEGREATGKSILGMLNAMADKTGPTRTLRDNMVARALTWAADAQAYSAKVRDNVFRENTAKALESQAGEYMTQAQTFRETVNARKAEVQQMEDSVQVLQQDLAALEQANPAIPAAVGPLQALEDAFLPWNQAEGARLAASRGSSEGKTPAEIAAQIRKWEQEVLPKLGVKNMAEFKQGYTKAKNEFDKGMREFRQTHGADPVSVDRYRQLAAQAEEANISLEAKRNDPALANADGLETTASHLDNLAVQLQTRANALREGILPGRPGFAPPLTEARIRVEPKGPGLTNWLRAEREAQVLAAKSRGLYDSGIDAVIAAGLSGDPVKSPLVFASTRHLRNLLDSDVGPIGTQISRTLESITKEISELEDALKTPVEARGKAPRLPNPNRELVDPDYAAKRAEKEQELADWNRNVRPGLEAQRKADQDRLAYLRNQRILLSKQWKDAMQVGSSTNPTLPREKVVSRKAGEIRAEMDQEVKDAGFSGGLKEVEGLLERPTLSSNKVNSLLLKRDKPRVGKAPPRDLSRTGRKQTRGKPPKAGTKARAAWEAKKASVKATYKAWKARKEQYLETRGEISDSGRYILLPDVPDGWVRPRNSTRSLDPDIHRPGDPIILKEGADGKLDILDGGVRYDAAAPGTPVRALIPVKALKKMLQNRLAGTRAGEFLVPKDIVTTTTIPGTPGTPATAGGFKVANLGGVEIIPHPNLHPDAQNRTARLNAEADEMDGFGFEGPDGEWVDRPLSTRTTLDKNLDQTYANLTDEGIPFGDPRVSQRVRETIRNTFKDPQFRADLVTMLEGNVPHNWKRFLSEFSGVYEELSGRPWDQSSYARMLNEGMAPQDVTATILADVQDVPITVDGVTHFPHRSTPAEVQVPPSPGTPPTPESTVTTTTPGAKFDPLAEANEWFDNLSPEMKSDLLTSEFHAVTQGFLEAEMPSLQAYRLLMGLDVPDVTPRADISEGGRELVGSMRYLNDELAVLRADLDSLHNSQPSTLGGMMMRSFYALESWAGKLNASRRVSDHISTTFRRNLVDALKLTPKTKPVEPSKIALEGGVLSPEMLDTPNLKGKVRQAVSEDPYAKVEIPLELRERMVDAIESLSTTPDQMRSLLKDYPALRDVFGTYFQLVQQWERMKILSPDMQSFFRRDVFFHSYPTMREVFKRVTSKGKTNKMPFTKAVTETIRRIETQADARRMNQEATESVLSGDWSFMADAPRTDAGKAERFLNIDDATRGRILRVDPDTEKGMKEINRITIGMALKNPVSDPSVMIANHIKAVYAADATRQMLRDLSNVAIPGMHELNPTTGRPYSIVEHFPGNTAQGTAVPVVPSLKSRMKVLSQGGAPGKEGAPVSRYISLAGDDFGMDPRSKIIIGGKEVEAGSLYIHPDVADMILDRFLSEGSEWGEAWAGFSELVRSGQLIGAPGAHALNILTDHWISLGQDALMGVLQGRHGIGTAVSRLFSAPFEAAGMGLAGQKMGGDVRLFVDAQLHGANFAVWDSMTRTAADQANKWVEAELGVGAAEGQSKAAQFFNRVTTKHDSPEGFWNTQRDAHALVGSKGEKAQAVGEAIVNGGLNLDYWGNNYLVFEPIKQSMLAAYHYWTAVHWKDMGQKLLAEGHSEATVLRLCKMSAADYVNTLSGTLRQSQDPKWFRNAVYSPVGLIGFVGATAPGWFRGKVNALLTPLDLFLDKAGQKVGQEGWGRLSQYGAISPAYRSYLRAKWGATMVYGFAASWASMQVYNMLTSGHPTFTHQDPTQRNRIQHGNVSYQWPFQGMYRDMFKMLDAGLSGDTSKALRTLAVDQMQPFPVKIGLEVALNDAALLRGGKQDFIYNPGGNLAGQAVDVTKHVMARMMSGPLEVVGLEDPAGTADFNALTPKWVLQATFGVRLNDYEFAPGNRGRIEKAEAYYQAQMQESIKSDIRKARRGDRAAWTRILDQTMVNGVPVESQHQALLGERYLMSAENVETLALSMAAPDVHYAEGLSPQELTQYWTQYSHYKNRQKRAGLDFLIRRLLKGEQ